VEQVQVKLKGAKDAAPGLVPVRAVPHWQEKGYELVDADAAKAAAERDGLDPKTFTPVTADGDSAESRKTTTARGGSSS